MTKQVGISDMLLEGSGMVTVTQELADKQPLFHSKDWHGKDQRHC